MAECVLGHSSDALKTTVQPTAIALAMPRVARMRAAFQGAIQRMGPMGSLNTKPIVFGFSVGGMTPVTLLTCAAISLRYDTESVVCCHIGYRQFRLS